MSRWLDEHIHRILGTHPDYRVKEGDWICITWMENVPCAEVIGIDEQGWPVVDHPITPEIGPISVDVYDVVRRKDDPGLFVGMGI